MNKKYAIIPILIISMSCSTHGMWTRASRQWSQLGKPTVRQKRFVQAAPQPKAQIPQTNETTESFAAITQQKPETQTPQTKITTKNIIPITQQIPTIKTPSSWSYWTKLFGQQHIPAATIPIQTEIQTINVISPQKLISWIDALKTLPEAKKLLQKLTNTAFNDIKTEAHIPDNIWTNLIKKEHDTIDYISQHCFSQPHSNATWDTMPQELQNLIVTELNNDKINPINPASLSVHYRDTVDIDPFGHDTISVTGPTIIYKTDMSSGESIIAGYEPATITLHKQNIAKLTKSQFVEKLQHTITHLKQAHDQQITLLKEAIGPEKYAQYAQPYKQALEREADLLEPITNAQIAKVVQRAFLDEALDSALNEVKENRKKHGLDNNETSLMICTPPGDGPIILESIASFENLEKFINDKKEQLYQELITSNGKPDYNKIEQFKATVNNDIQFINTIYYKKNFEMPEGYMLHDQDLPFLNNIKHLLEDVGKNPNSTVIFNAYGYSDDAVCYGVTVSRDENNIPQCKRPAGLGFNKYVLEKLSPEEQTFIFAHEIGHLLENHTLIKAHLKQFINPTNDQSKLHELYRLQEIEADISYAKKNPFIAKMFYKSWLNKLSTQQLYLLQSTIMGGRPLEPHEQAPTHPSFFDRYYWIKKIVELHQKEAAQKQKNQPLFAPERE